MYKFCIIKYLENYDYLNRKFVFMKNKKFRDFYIKKFYPFKVEPLVYGSLVQYEGLTVSLPITKEDAMENEETLIFLVEKVIEYLKNQNVNIVYYEDIDYRSGEITYIDELSIPFLFTKEILNKVIKVNNFSRKDVSVCIISGEFDETNIVLNQIYDNLNFLYLIEKDGNFTNYEEITDYIFCDSGLEVSFVNSVKSADIIINLSKNPNVFLKNISEHSVIISFKGDIDRTITKNNVVINSFDFKCNDNYLKDYEAELILYSNNLNFRRFKYSNNKMGVFINTLSQIKALGITFLSYKESK